MKRAAAISMAALLSVGGATTALAASAGAQTVEPSTTTTSIDPTTSTTEATAPVVTDFSITLAGLGDISLSVDPITHEISNIVVTPLDGITVADLIAVHNGIQLDFTLADGTVKSVVVEIEGHHGTVRLEVEDPKSENDDHHGDGPPAIEDRGNSAEHRNDAHDRHGPDATTPPATNPTTTGSPSVNRGPSESDSSDRQESESQSGRTGRSGSRD